MPHPALEYDHIEKSFFGVPVLKKVSFALRPASVLGLVGENGAGKSTLMNILGGVLRADDGAMRLDGQDYKPESPSDAARRGVAFIHQELNLFTNLSVAENIFIDALPRRRLLGVPFVDRRAMRERAKSLLEAVSLNVSPDTLVEDLPPGERQLVEIAKALSVEARIIIFDEPTTSLTARETERLFALIARLRAQGIAMIYISHALDDVLRLADDVVVLRDGQVVGAGRRDEFTAGRMIALMVGRALDQLYPPREAGPSHEVALEVRALSQPGVVKEVSFALHKGEVLGVAGLMGSGRSELARIIFGLDPFAAGEILLDGRRLDSGDVAARIKHRMAFLTENRREEGLMMEASVAENMSLVALPAFTRSGLIQSARLGEALGEAAGAVRLKAASLDRQAVKSLSGGNQQKAVLAKWLLSAPTVFILDEPTRGVDVGAKHEIYRLINDLTARGAGVLMISSETEELMGMCDRILVMSRGEIKGSFGRGRFDREKFMRLAVEEGGRKSEAGSR
jgi:ribose transport system ATP-binding protein